MKFCGLVRPADVDAAVALGADAIGFVFYPRSPRLLDPDTAAALRRRLPSWVTAVGLFVDAPPEEIAAVARRVGLDVAQLHGDETPAAAATLPLRWWKAIRIGEGGVGASPAEVAAELDTWHHAECRLLDSASVGYGGSGRAFDWSLVPEGGRGPPRGGGRPPPTPRTWARRSRGCGRSRSTRPAESRVRRPGRRT